MGKNICKNIFSKSRKDISNCIKYLHKRALTDKNFKIYTRVLINYKSKRFRFFVFDIFMIKEVSVMVAGVVSSGTIKVGDSIIIKKPNGVNIKSKIIDIEYFKDNKVIPGASIGLFLDKVDIKTLETGDVIEKKTLFNIF